MTSIVSVKDLHFSYGKLDALKGLSFEAEANKITGILGPNGSGKSTTFKILSTQLQPSNGEAFVNGASTTGDRKKVRASLGVTFQSPSLDPILTVQENLEIFAALVGLSGTAKKESISKVLSGLRLEDRRNSKIKELSGGLARRVELAKTLLMKPKLLLLDEPTTGLDPLARTEFWTELRKLRDQGISILVTTHLMDEAEMCDELIFLTEGKLAAQGTPTSLKSEFGADILSIELQEGEKLFEALKTRLSANDKIVFVNGKIRIESNQPMKIFEEIKTLAGTRIHNFSWGKPTLGDVYLSRTGKSL